MWGGSALTKFLFHRNMRWITGAFGVSACCDVGCVEVGSAHGGASVKCYDHVVCVGVRCGEKLLTRNLMGACEAVGAGPTVL